MTDGEEGDLCATVGIFVGQTVCVPCDFPAFVAGACQHPDGCEVAAVNGDPCKFKLRRLQAQCAVCPEFATDIEIPDCIWAV